MNKRIKALCLSVLTLGMLGQSVPVKATVLSGLFSTTKNTLYAAGALMAFQALRAVKRYVAQVRAHETFEPNEKLVGYYGTKKGSEIEPQRLAKWLSTKVLSRSNAKQQLTTALKKNEIIIPDRAYVTTGKKQTLKFSKVINFEKQQLEKWADNQQAPGFIPVPRPRKGSLFDIFGIGRVLRFIGNIPSPITFITGFKMSNLSGNHYEEHKTYYEALTKLEELLKGNATNVSEVNNNLSVDFS